MADEEFSQSEIEHLRRLFQHAALNDFPNPERIGCPPDKSVLKAMAAKKLVISDPAWRHAARCSPCFREIKGFEADLRTSTRRTRGAAIAVLILFAIGALIFRERYPRQGTRSTYQTAVLDLRRYSPERTEAEKPAIDQKPLSLNRGNLTVSVLLPVGAETGQYEYKVLNDSLQAVLSGAGVARVENQTTMLLAKLDMEPFPSGRYTLWLRQPGSDWRRYPVVLR